MPLANSGSFRIGHANDFYAVIQLYSAHVLRRDEDCLHVVGLACRINHQPQTCSPIDRVHVDVTKMANNVRLTSNRSSVVAIVRMLTTHLDREGDNSWPPTMPTTSKSV